jgi:hypothetical protein
LKANPCHPEQCPELDEAISLWIESARQYSRHRPDFDWKMKHPRKIVEYARKLSLNLDPAYSSRDIARMIWEKYGEKVSNVTVLSWISRAQNDG